MEKEKILSNYRSKYMGGLPDELESNLRTLDRLQQQLTDRQTMLRETRNSIALLKAQLAQIQEDRSRAKDTMAMQVAISTGDAQAMMSDASTRLTRAELELESLRLRYTDRHPDVIKQKATVERLKQLVAKEDVQVPKEDAPKTGVPIAASDDLPATSDPVPGTQDTRQFNQLEKEERRIQMEMTDIQNRMNIYQKRVDETPRREQELRSLERDYSNIQAVYSSLMDRKLEAELSVNMEKKQKGEQFRILDRARLPQRPISPNVKKLFVFSAAAGLGLGGGVIFLLVFLDGSVRRDEDIEEQLGLPILATIPPLKRKKDRLRNQMEIFGFVMVLAWLFLLLAGFAVLNLKGLDWMVNLKLRLMGILG